MSFCKKMIEHKAYSLFMMYQFSNALALVFDWVDSELYDIYNNPRDAQVVLISLILCIFGICAAARHFTRGRIGIFQIISLMLAPAHVLVVVVYTRDILWACLQHYLAII